MNKILLLQCSNLCKSYKEGQIRTDVLRNVNVNVYKKDMIAVVGSSGSGKSTLLYLMSGLDVPTSGEVIFSGTKMSKMSSKEKSYLRNRKLGFIYQFHYLLPDFTALENVAMPLLIAKKSLKEVIPRANKMLKEVGLEYRSNHYPSELSGGERQKVAIARALINNPELVLADEPTGNLDECNTNTVFHLLNKINSLQGTTFLVVTHNSQLARRMGRRLEMRDGQIMKDLSLVRTDS